MNKFNQALGVVASAVFFQSCSGSQFTSATENLSKSVTSNNNSAFVQSGHRSVASGSSSTALPALSQVTASANANSSSASSSTTTPVVATTPAAATSAPAVIAMAPVAAIVRPAPRAGKLEFSPWHDPYVYIYTGATVTEDVYACIEDYNDSSFPCRNGDISKTFVHIPKPSNPLSATQELIWWSPDLFYVEGIDFTDYTIFFMKKNAAGALTESLGSVRIGIRIPADEIGDGKSGTLSGSSGPNQFEFSCGSSNQSDYTPAAGFKSYRYAGGLDCYYKISRR